MLANRHPGSNDAAPTPRQRRDDRVADDVAWQGTATDAEKQAAAERDIRTSATAPMYRG